MAKNQSSTKRARLRRSDNERQGACAHLVYEVQMMSHLAEKLSTGELGSGHVPNAVLEAFTIHTRVLLSFLYEDNPRPDDVSAGDYFDDPQDWILIRPAKSDLLDLVYGRVNKEVAHLTYGRLSLTEDTRTWQFMDIAEQLIALMNFFYEHAPKHLLTYPAR
jgi:hypothetical protein